MEEGEVQIRTYLFLNLKFKSQLIIMPEQKLPPLSEPQVPAAQPQKKGEPETIGKKLRKFSIETRLKSSNDFKGKVLNLFKDYVKAIVVWGSVIRGDFTGKSDVDIYIIFDDTKMPLKKFDEIRNKVDDDIWKLAKETDPRLHVQPVIALTEFWDGIRTSHPLFYNIVGKDMQFLTQDFSFQ